MSFETELRSRIVAAKFGSTEKNILRVVLGESQQKAPTGEITDNVGIGVVRKIIDGNKENIGTLPKDDPRRGHCEEENPRLLKAIEDNKEALRQMPADDPRRSQHVGEISRLTTVIEVNKKSLGYLPKDDPRRGQYEEENLILVSLLPVYLSVGEIREALAPLEGEIKAAKPGPAVGVAMGHFRKSGQPVEGDAVKRAVEIIRGA